MGLLAATGEVYTHEADRFPVADRANLLHTRAIAAQWNLELEPSYILCLTIRKRHFAYFLFGDVLASHFHHVGAQEYSVLVVFLVFVECVIKVDVFHIGCECGGSTVGFCLLLCSGRVSFGAVVMLVSVKNRHFVSVEVATSIIVEIIAGGVVERREIVASPSGQYIRGNALFKCFDILAVSGPCLLLLVAESIQTDILSCACAFLITKGGDSRGGAWHISPDSGIHASKVGVGDRHAVLKSFLAITQDIFANITKVDIHLSVISLRVGECWVHEPELNILDIGFLKVGIIQSAHHTSPALLRVGKASVAAHLFCGDIILSAFVWVVSEVEDRQFGIYRCCVLTIRVYLILIHDTRAMVAECSEVILNMRRCVILRMPENRVHGVPR